jgi:hypothetical protein
MPTHTLSVVNKSSYTPPDGDRTLRAITQAIGLQLKHVASAWGQGVWDVVAASHARGFHIALLDNETTAWDLGWHDFAPHRQPYARVFLDPILGAGGHWLEGSLSVSATVSHEACELVVDPACNRWAQSKNGSFWSLEVCDPVEAYVYSLVIRDGTKVSVSDFVYPDWFNPLARPDATMDEMKKLSKPFEIAPGGYATRSHAGNVRSVNGPRHPEARKKDRAACGSRTRVRLHFGCKCPGPHARAARKGKSGRGLT